jgi:hemerythrin-like domain-containing protein
MEAPQPEGVTSLSSSPAPGVCEGEQSRLVAWSGELRTVHERLREALDVTRTALARGEPAEPASREVLLFCHGFCAALTGHHGGEDHLLFPAIAAEHPELRETLRHLSQDHSMMSYLLGDLQSAVERQAPPDDLVRHLDGLSAIMESHFRFEERQLLTVLEGLDLRADVAEVLGPL